MPEQLSLMPPADGTDAISLAQYAERAYLEYALSVVKGRALPDVCDGNKPVQRRILYSMHRMGLSFSGSGGAKPVKSARVVGDVLGKFHPHSDTAAYDALVRMAQDFSQRYPLVDGQGNFGSRDGDGAAAMRYTEARLSPIARCCSTSSTKARSTSCPTTTARPTSPRCCRRVCRSCCSTDRRALQWAWPPRCPATTCARSRPPRWRCCATTSSRTTTCSSCCPAPDYPGGGQIISSEDEIRAAYAGGRGSLKVRARWKTEDLARGQWQMVVTELPPYTSAQKVLEEIEELTNPKVKAGKKALTQEQVQLKQTVLAVLDAVRDESGKDAPVRLVFEPKTRTIEPAELSATLLAHTSLETSAPINLTMVGRDGKPTQKGLRQVLLEWVAFRQATVQRRSQHRLQKVLDRIHILEGRQLVLLNIDEVIRIIRKSDEPKPALINKFKLSDRQADDILDLRLRQLARLEAIKIEQELKELREDQGKLQDILGSPAVLKRTVIKEIEADAKTHGDERRTLIQVEKRAVAEIRVVDEPVTVVVSLKGWVRRMQGHEVDGSTLAFKAGDGLYGTFACRSVDTLLVFGSNGRVYSVAVSGLPGGRGDGQPITSLIELESGTQAAHYFAGHGDTMLMLANTGGFGLQAKASDMQSRQRGGKAFLTLEPGDNLLPPVAVAPDHDRLACLSLSGHLLVFALDEVKLQSNGGRGLTLMDVDAKDPLLSVASCHDAITVLGAGRTGKPREETLRGAALTGYAGKRARKGKLAPGMKSGLRVVAI